MPRAQPRPSRGALRSMARPSVVTGRTLRPYSPARSRRSRRANRHVLYLADAEVSDWTRAALRQCDEILVLLGMRPPRRDVAPFWTATRRRDRAVGATSSSTPRTERRRQGSRASAASRAFDFVHHVRRRRIGAASCGSSRGAPSASPSPAAGRAHSPISACCGPAEAGIPPTSSSARAWARSSRPPMRRAGTHDEIVVRMRQAFVASSPLGDLMWPWIALFRGERVKRLLRDGFGTLAIEDLPLPFACVTDQPLDRHRLPPQARAARRGAEGERLHPRGLSARAHRRPCACGRCRRRQPPGRGLARPRCRDPSSLSTSASPAGRRLPRHSGSGRRAVAHQHDQRGRLRGDISGGWPISIFGRPSAITGFWIGRVSRGPSRLAIGRPATFSTPRAARSTPFARRPRQA